jgi:hypothetical protein
LPKRKGGRVNPMALNPFSESQCGPSRPSLPLSTLRVSVPHVHTPPGSSRRQPPLPFHRCLLKGKTDIYDDDDGSGRESPNGLRRRCPAALLLILCRGRLRQTTATLHRRRSRDPRYCHCRRRRRRRLPETDAAVAERRCDRRRRRPWLLRVSVAAAAAGPRRCRSHRGGGGTARRK